MSLLLLFNGALGSLPSIPQKPYLGRGGAEIDRFIGGDSRIAALIGGDDQYRVATPIQKIGRGKTSIN